MSEKHTVIYTVMQDRRGQSSLFGPLGHAYESQEKAEAAIVAYMAKADAFAGCPDLWVKKTYHFR